MDLYWVSCPDFSANQPTKSWLRRYFITLTSFQPLYGKMSDIFGRKSALLFGYAIFGLGCLFCGLARNMNELVAARVSLKKGGRKCIEAELYRRSQVLAAGE